MKLTKMIALVVVLFIGNIAMAQKKASPAAETKTSVNGADIKINYSQPSVKGREVWGGLVPFDKVWITGANEATTFETSKDIKVQGKSLKAGKYTLFTIPNGDEWKIIFNSKLGQWGAYAYSSSDDVLTVTAKPTASDFVEVFDISANNGKISLAWEKVKVDFTLE
jgi:hypothetical protein